jgi:hypothetical protein
MAEVSTLDGLELDIAVARAEIAGGALDVKLSDAGMPTIATESGGWEPFRPSVSWAHAGPIIEAARITLVAQGFEPYHWIALVETDSTGGAGPLTGHTPLVAAMRAYVASKA